MSFMIIVQDISKSYGAELLFENVSFSLSSGERLGLVGRNGHGKSTLLRILSNREHPDHGNLTVPRDYRIGFLEQNPAMDFPSVLDAAAEGLPRNERSADWKVKKILSGLGFSQKDFTRPPGEFSGGYRMRIALTRVLVGEPDLLLLDEPTNFLDIVSIRWLTSFLNQWRGELILISHDRGFMDAIVCGILGIHRKRIRRVSGNTRDYYEQIAQEEAIHEKHRLNEESRKKQMEQFIHRFRAKARHANLVQSRIKCLEKQKSDTSLEAPRLLDFSFSFTPAPPKYCLRVHGLEFGYAGGASRLIRGLSITVRPWDRIGIVGRNGKGKTTLLKLLAGELTPDAGVIERHPQTRAAYFSQDQSRTLFEERTVEQEVVVSLPAGERHRARDLCGVMMFSKDAAFKKVKVLSGGERSRVCLAKTLGTPANLLYLDEPTHHLDLESSDALMDAIRRFEGAVLLVTHSEHLLKHAVNRLIVFKENRVFVFEGGYLEMIERHGWDELEPGFDSSSQSTAVSRRKRARRERARFVAERARAIKPLERKIASIEKRIDEREVLITRNNRALVEASKIGDAGAIEKLSRERSRIEREIEELYPLLLEAGETLENEKKRFEREEAETAENQSCSDA